MNFQGQRNVSITSRIQACVKINAGGCWIWQLTTFKDGYPCICILGSARRAQRVAYEAFVGKAPNNAAVRQKCGEVLCCNPEHLFLETPERYSTLPHARLLSLIDYDPITGIFRWKESRGHKISPGDVAGLVNLKGYRRIHILQKTYEASRLAWFYMTGKWPESLMDHINRDPGDNRFDNLREANCQQSTWNRKLPKNKVGYTGVRVITKSQRFAAVIRKDGRDISLGTFATPELASEEYQRAAKELRGDYHPESADPPTPQCWGPPGPVSDGG